MKRSEYATKVESYLKTFCGVKPNRRTGSAGNWEATVIFADTLRSYGYKLDTTPFECLDYASDEARMAHADNTFEAHVSPYSLGCDVLAELVVVSTIEELERVNCEGKLLLLRGPICSEQLTPKKFAFYNPEHHQKIIGLLESRRPAGIVSATERNPEQVGALYPFPLIVDGDFDIPSVYCKNTVGDMLASIEGEAVQLRIDARRLSSSASNVIARTDQRVDNRIVITAHIDAYEDAPGASDNASGTVVLLLLAEMLSGYRGNNCIEIAAFNGEDHYSAGGQMDYLRRYGNEFPGIRLAVNVDGVGFKQGRTSYSFYGCTQQLDKKAENVFRRFNGLVRGAPWFNGDHMIFVHNRVPSVAFTSECVVELMKTVTHTSSDTPDIIDCHKLVEVAESLNALVRSF